VSIIQEALKKAQDTYLKKTAPKKEPVQELQKDNIVNTQTEHFSMPVPAHHAVMPLPILLIASIIILTVLIGFGFKSFSSGHKTDPAKEPSSYQETSIKQISKEPVQDIAPEAEGIISPFRRTIPSSFMAGGTPELVLNGIMYLQEGPKAIINSTVVREGDLISGATVKAINKNNVLLSFNDSEITLTLRE